VPPGPVAVTIAAMEIHLPTGVKALVVQAIGVGILGAATGIAFSHAFFEDWGWLIGPVAWMIAATVTALLLKLPLPATLLGAVLAGIPSAILTAAGLHWAGAVVAILLFAGWCGGVGGRRMTPETG
jgi:hypothetical protein